MKKLLTFLLTTSFLSTNVVMLIACSNTKINDSDNDEGLTEDDNLKEEINEEISKHIITSSENTDDGHGYIVKSYKDIGYTSFDQVQTDVKDQTKISNKSFENRIVEHIIKPKLSSISGELKQKYDVFREQEDIIQLADNLTITKEIIQLDEITKLLKEESSATNNDLANTPAEELGLIYKFSLNFSTKYTLNNDVVSKQHTINFYIANDVSKFTSIQDVLTNYVKNKITTFFKNLVYQNFPNSDISDDINQLISTYTNKKYLPSYIQNIFKSTNTQNSNSALKINGSAILSSDTERSKELLQKITNFDANINEIFDVLDSEDPGNLNNYIKDNYQDYLNSKVFTNKTKTYEALKFSLDIISSEIYGYNLKSIFIKDIKVHINYEKLIEKVKDELDKISTAIRILFLNSDSKIKKINPSLDIDPSIKLYSNTRWYRWTLNMKENQKIWDASDCFEGEKHCVTWDNEGTPIGYLGNKFIKYLIDLINKYVLNDWFIKGKIQNDKDFKDLYKNLTVNLSMDNNTFTKLIDRNYDFKEKPIEYGTNVKDRIHFYQFKSATDGKYYFEKSFIYWQVKLNSINMNIYFPVDISTHFIVQQS